MWSPSRRHVRMFRRIEESNSIIFRDRYGHFKSPYSAHPSCWQSCCYLTVPVKHCESLLQTLLFSQATTVGRTKLPLSATGLPLLVFWVASAISATPQANLLMRCVHHLLPRMKAEPMTTCLLPGPRAKRWQPFQPLTILHWPVQSTRLENEKDRRADCSQTTWDELMILQVNHSHESTGCGKV